MTHHQRYASPTTANPPPLPQSSFLSSSLISSQFDHEVDIFLNAISPTYETNQMRSSIITYIKKIFQHYSVGCNVVMGGSFPLKVYLPESDLDAVILTRQSPNEIDDLKDILDIFSCLCRAINENDKIIPNGNYEEMKIQRIEFINARIKVVKCVINQTSLDITANQKSSLASATFLEEADRIIGKQHLYKRSVILIKAWCLHESSKYHTSNMPIIGAKVGMFSSYAISILILYLFNILPTEEPSGGASPPGLSCGLHASALGIPGKDTFYLPFSHVTHPLHVLRAFLFIYSRFQWDNFVLALDGPAGIRNGTLVTQPPPPDPKSSTSPTPPLPMSQNLFKDIAAQVRDSYDPQTATSSSSSHHHPNFRPPHRFSLRYLNIVDPVDVTNNLGISVSLRNSKVIQTILFHASQHLESFYAWALPSSHHPPHSHPSSHPSHQAPPLSANPSRSQSQQHFHPSPGPSSIQTPLPSYGNSFNIAPGLPPTNPQPPTPPAAAPVPPPPAAPPHSSSPAMNGVYSSSPFHPHTHTAPSFHHQHHHNSPQPFPSSSANHFVHSNSSPQLFHTSGPSNSNPPGDLPSFLAVYFSQSLFAYQPLLRASHPPAPVPVPRRSITASSTSNLLDQGGSGNGDKKSSRISPPNRGRSSSYSSSSGNGNTSNMVTTVCSGSATALDELSTALCETAQEFDNLDSDIMLMWNSLRYIPPSPSPCVTPSHRIHTNTITADTPPPTPTNKKTPRGGKGGGGGRKMTSPSISPQNSSVPSSSPSEFRSSLNLSVAVDAMTATPEQSESDDCQEQEQEQQSNPDGSHALSPPAPAPVDSNTSPLPQHQRDDTELLHSPLAPPPPSASPPPSCPLSEKTTKQQNFVAVAPTSSISSPQLTQKKTDEFTKDSHPPHSSRHSHHQTSAHFSLSNLLLSLLLSIFLLFLLVGYLHHATDSSDYNITTLTQKLFCSSFENFTLPNPPTASSSTTSSSSSSLPTSAPSVPVVHATLLEKENIPAYRFLPESDIQTTEVWVLKDQQLTLGLNSFAQDIFYDSTLRQNISGVWLHEQEIYRSSRTGCCTSSPHLFLDTVSHPGVYQFVLYDQYAHLLRGGQQQQKQQGTAREEAVEDEGGRGGGMGSHGNISSAPSAHLTKSHTPSSSGPLFSCCVAITEGDQERGGRGGDMVHSMPPPPPAEKTKKSTGGRGKEKESLVPTSSSAPPSTSSAFPMTTLGPEDILRVISKSYVRIAVPPSSKTKPKHLTLTSGSSQLYLHMQPEGSPPPSLQWYRNGLLLPHETKNILVVNEVNKSHEGTYSCRLTNMAGVFTWLEATVEIRPLPRLSASSTTSSSSPSSTATVPAHHHSKKGER